MSGQHHGWPWKALRIDGKEYLSVEFVERCAAEAGLPEFSARGSGTVWHFGKEVGEEWLYVERAEVLTRLVAQIKQREALHGVLVLVNPEATP